VDQAVIPISTIQKLPALTVWIVWKIKGLQILSFRVCGKDESPLLWYYLSVKKKLNFPPEISTYQTLRKLEKSKRFTFSGFTFPAEKLENWAEFISGCKETDQWTHQFEERWFSFVFPFKCSAIYKGAITIHFGTI